MPSLFHCFGVTAPTRAALKALEGEGIVTEISGRSWRRTYLAEEIYEAVREPE